MKLLICALLLFVSFKSNAQYPFEKYPAIKYDTVSIRQFNRSIDTYEKFKAIATYKHYRIEFLGKPLADSSNILLYYKDKIIKKIKFEEGFSNIDFTDPIYIADINGDGLFDFKIVLNNMCCGNAAMYYYKIYLFNQGNNIFQKQQLYDLYSHTERNFNNDANFEIIGQVYQYYKNHSYFVFDIYNYKKGRLVNVSAKYNYPIATQFLWEESYEITHKIPHIKLLKFSQKYPSEYTHD